jgi:hypothetical protein
MEMWYRSASDLLLGAVGIIFVLLLVATVYGTVEHVPLGLVSPPAGINAESWAAEFDQVQWNYVFLPAGGCAFLWVLITSLMDAGVMNDRRFLWIALYVVAACIGVYGLVSKMPETSGGHLIAATIMVAHVLLAYWLMTAFTTAQTHKYAPFIASSLRRW